MPSRTYPEIDTVLHIEELRCHHDGAIPTRSAVDLHDTTLRYWCPTCGALSTDNSLRVWMLPGTAPEKRAL